MSPVPEAAPNNDVGFGSRLKDGVYLYGVVTMGTCIMLRHKRCHPLSHIDPAAQI